MCTENETTELVVDQTPQVFMQSIAFNDNTVLPLVQNSIVVFTGANNSGKSQVLRDVENCIGKSNADLNVIIKNFQYSFCGNINDEAFIEKHFSRINRDIFKLLAQAMLLKKAH